MARNQVAEHYASGVRKENKQTIDTHDSLINTVAHKFNTGCNSSKQLTCIAKKKKKKKTHTHAQGWNYKRKPLSTSSNYLLTLSGPSLARLLDLSAWKKKGNDC